MATSVEASFEGTETDSDYPDDPESEQSDSDSPDSPDSPEDSSSAQESVFD
jgi:hypothetical protein